MPRCFGSLARRQVRFASPRIWRASMASSFQVHNALIILRPPISLFRSSLLRRGFQAGRAPRWRSSVVVALTAYFQLCNVGWPTTNRQVPRAIHETIINFDTEDVHAQVWGTCAGMILLADGAVGQKVRARVACSPPAHCCVIMISKFSVGWSSTRRGASRPSLQKLLRGSGKRARRLSITSLRATVRRPAITCPPWSAGGEL